MDNKEIFDLASDIDYACTSKDISLEDELEIAKTLIILGYSKKNNNKHNIKNDLGSRKKIGRQFEPLPMKEFRDP